MVKSKTLITNSVSNRVQKEDLYLDPYLEFWTWRSVNGEVHIKDCKCIWTLLWMWKRPFEHQQKPYSNKRTEATFKEFLMTFHYTTTLLQCNAMMTVANIISIQQQATFRMLHKFTHTSTHTNTYTHMQLTTATYIWGSIIKHFITRNSTLWQCSPLEMNCWLHCTAILQSHKRIIKGTSRAHCSCLSSVLPLIALL